MRPSSASKRRRSQLTEKSLGRSSTLLEFPAAFGPTPTVFGVGTLTWQDPVHSWKAGPGEVMTVEKQTNKQKHYLKIILICPQI